MSDEDSYQIPFSDEALGSMVLAASEPYCLGDRERPDGDVEIDGYLWGLYGDFEDHTLIQVEKFAPSFAPPRTPESVEPSEAAAQFGAQRHGAALPASVVPRGGPHSSLRLAR